MNSIIESAIRQMISISDDEFYSFINQTSVKVFRKNGVLSRPHTIPNEIFFINRGLLRKTIIDQHGNEQTIHFALENQFIADYSSYILQQTSPYSLVALEDTEVVVIPRSCIDWGYSHLKEGQKLGRLIAEYYFIYQDLRIKNTLARTPKERYDEIEKVFPNIHNRVPQHMIASYLGITAVHLSRLKKVNQTKV